MSLSKLRRKLGILSAIAALGTLSANAQQQVRTVFVIAMENHNWTQPANQFTGSPQQVYLNPNAPFINSLVNGTASVVIGCTTVNICQQVAYATSYLIVLAPASCMNPHFQPWYSNYVWAEA